MCQRVHIFEKLVVLFCFKNTVGAKVYFMTLYIRHFEYFIEIFSYIFVKPLPKTEEYKTESQTKSQQ